MSAAEDGLHPFERLTPDFLLDALQSVGWRGDGRLLALNSYENRVWQVGLEEGDSVIAKFYRPQRWSADQLHEEHRFARELVDAEVPVVAPLAADDGDTLHAYQGFHFAVFPRRGGRAPELDRPDVLERMGYFIGRLHTVGAAQPFVVRPAISLETFGQEPRAFLLDSGLIPADLRPAWEAISGQALEAAAHAFASCGAVRVLRLPWRLPSWQCAVGGCRAAFCRPGRRPQRPRGAGPLDAAVRRTRGDDAATASCAAWLPRLPALRPAGAGADRTPAHPAPAPLQRLDRATLGRPAFPHNFPWFGTQRYWQDRILELREQVGAMQEPALSVPWDD